MDAAKAIEALTEEEISTIATRGANGEHTPHGPQTSTVIGYIAAGALRATEDPRDRLTSATWGGILFGSDSHNTSNC